MNGDGPYVLYYAMAAALVASALFSRRIPLGQATKMVLAWALIFFVAFGLFAFRSEFRSVGHRLYAAAFGTPVQVGDELRIPMAEDGHFWVSGSVNGVSTRFLIDSGASVTTISAETAARAGIEPSARRSTVQTANGAVVMVQAEAKRLEIGSIARDEFPVNLSDRDSTNILGMNFLSSLDGWRVENGDLVLRP